MDGREIDTIREALEYYMEIEVTGPGKEALAILSTIDPNAEPQEPSEDAVAFCRKHQYLMSPKIIQARDDAIRRECADSGLDCMRINEGWSEDSLGWYRLESAILATEPAQGDGKAKHER